MVLGHRLIVIVITLLVGVGPQPALARTQQATPRAGSEEQREIEIPDRRIIALSPDGTLFVVGNPAANRPSELCVIEVATLVERVCADLEEHGVSVVLDSVVWSPDSTKIAFSESAFVTFRDGDLWVMDATTGEITNLTDDGFEGGAPVLSDEEPPADPIYFDVLPAWAPNGRSIAFSRSTILGGTFTGNQVVSVDLASGEVETLASVTPEEPGVVYFGLAWAPDGQRLYYSVTYPNPDEADNGVWLYDAATGSAEHILENDSEKGQPALIDVAAKGQTGLIIYPYFMMEYATEPGGYALLDLATNTLSPVNPVPLDQSSPAIVRAATFSPDGTKVLYGLHQLEDDTSRFLVRGLPDGEPELVAEVDGPPFMTTLGGGLSWASDGTVFAATDLVTGVLFHLAGGQPPPAPVATPIASPAASPVPTGDEFPPGTTVTLTGEASMRATPSSRGTIVLDLRPNAELMVIGEPVEAGGETWVPVVEPATGTIGYVEASLLQSAKE